MSKPHLLTVETMPGPAEQTLLEFFFVLKNKRLGSRKTLFGPFCEYFSHLSPFNWFPVFCLLWHFPILSAKLFTLAQLGGIQRENCP